MGGQGARKTEGFLSCSGMDAEGYWGGTEFTRVRGEGVKLDQGKKLNPSRGLPTSAYKTRERGGRRP